MTSYLNLFSPGPSLTVKDCILPVLSGSLQAFGYIAWKQACKYEPSVVKVNIILNFQIIITFVIDLLLVSRDFKWTRIVGALCVFLGGCVIIMSKVKRKGSEDQPVSQTVKKVTNLIEEPTSTSKLEVSPSQEEEAEDTLSPVVKPAQLEDVEIMAKDPVQPVDIDSEDSNDSVEQIDSDKVHNEVPEVAIQFSDIQTKKNQNRFAEIPTRTHLDEPAYDPANIELSKQVSI